ncbi:FecCD family ABC transporter permease [Capillimicrobium parvum]|uniref:Fe(3+) dicitrate transport system permease protein FecD n=1 Tax=Capillimicrobium parvum TaxID=2884022 RepID=A0A9E6Y0H6_9ACTN|nr:iron ABC transporter permease [Capillimicrobium parvum]UGS37922.1 Fe(3+) dicitrate transport system permease protein FecD [Capillimicrobium parvum]
MTPPPSVVAGPDRAFGAVLAAAGRRALTRRVLVVAGVLAALLAAVACSLALGAVRIPLHAVVDVLLGRDAHPIDREILLQLRLPRTVTALAVGAALGVAGALLQGSLGNPLASPDVIGVTGGAAFGAMLIILLAPGKIALLPLSAMGFGLLAAAMVALVAWTGANRGSVTRLILSGIAVGAMFTAATSMLMALYPSRVPSAVMWLAGGLVSDGWETIAAVGPYLAGGLLVAVALVRPLDRLALGDEVAASLGTHPRTVRLVAIAAAAVLAAGSAALAGLLGFLGIVVPHAVRLLGGTSSHGFVVPVSALAGAALLTGGDVVARTIKAPLELPVGPMMVVIGVPLFLWLLRRAV